jgi:hypothetical protein
MLLIFAPAPSDRTYRLQMEQLDSIRLALEDQRVIIAEIFENAAGRLGRAELSQERCRDFRRQFNVPPGHFKAILMGRDSVTHLCSNECISWQELMLRMEEVSEFQIPAVL